jgi:serine/threonine-protein kinase RsbW
MLQQASVAFGSATSEAALVIALADIAGVATDATTTAVMLVESATHVLQSAMSGSNPLGDLVALDDPRPESDAIRFCRPVTVSSSDDTRHRYPTMVQMLRDTRLEAVSAVPLPSDDAPLGVLVCFYRRRRDFSDDEMGLQQALARQAAQALERIRLQHQLLNLAMHDNLTGLANREMLQERLEQVLSASERHNRPMALIFLDLDGFKAINDGLGHVVGDAVLVEVGDRLRRAVRRSDTIARFGGDEFVVLCEDADALTATEVAERILRSIAEPLDGLAPGQHLTASVGVAYHTGDRLSQPSADAVILAADAAMYRSKAEGKNRHTLVTV